MWCYVFKNLLIVHRQHLFYCGDKGFHFLTAEVITCPWGFLLCVVIAYGHNNDKGLFNSGSRGIIERLNITGLAGRGYLHPQRVRPDNSQMASRSRVTVDKFGACHSKHRAPGEIINSLSKIYNFASGCVTQSPEFQAYGLMIVYYLTGEILLDSPTWYLSRLHITRK